MSNKEQMMRQAEAEHQMNLPASAPSYEEAMRYPSIPQLPMEIPYQPQHPQPVIIQPQPVFNPQPIQPMPPPIQPQVHTIIHHNQRLGPESTKVTCPSCKMEIHTKVEYTPTMKTHIMAILLCIFGCCCCACCPYCVDSCQNGNHNCPNCNAYIGTYTG